MADGISGRLRTPPRHSEAPRHSDTGCVGAMRWSDNDLDVLVERYQRLHQPFERNVLEFVASDLGHLGLGHAGDAGRLHLAEAALGDQLVELERKRRLRRQLIGVIETEVNQHVVGTLWFALT